MFCVFAFIIGIIIVALHCSLLICISVFMLLFVTDTSLPDPYHSFSKYQAFAHMPVSNTSRIQEWTDSYNGISTQFVYEPEKPIIDTFTELKFSIQNTTTGDHISDNEDAIARVVVTNGQRLFKFENISVGNNGHFSVKYIFPDDGTHQVITRLDTNDSSTASSFNVFVPHQAPPSILNPFPSSPTTASDNNQQIAVTAILIGIISSVAVATIFLIKRK
jgi:hypothetical protein